MAEPVARGVERDEQRVILRRGEEQAGEARRGARAGEEPDLVHGALDELVERGVHLDERRGRARGQDELDLAEERGAVPAAGRRVPRRAGAHQGIHDGVALRAADEEVDVLHRACCRVGVGVDRQRGALDQERREARGGERSRDGAEDVRAQERGGVGVRAGVAGHGGPVAEEAEDLRGDGDAFDEARRVHRAHRPGHARAEEEGVGMGAGTLGARGRVVDIVLLTRRRPASRAARGAMLPLCRS